jgi:hypothetical protein
MADCFIWSDLPADPGLSEWQGEDRTAGHLQRVFFNETVSGLRLDQM